MINFEEADKIIAANETALARMPGMVGLLGNLIAEAQNSATERQNDAQAIRYLTNLAGSAVEKGKAFAAMRDQAWDNACVQACGELGVTDAASAAVMTRMITRIREIAGAKP